MAKLHGTPSSKKFEKPKDSKKTIKRLWEYIKKEQIKIIFVIIILLFSVILDVLSIYILSPIIDKYIMPLVKSGGEAIYVKGLIKMMCIFLSINIIYTICGYISSKIMIKIAQNTIMIMKNNLVVKIEKLPIKYFDTHPHGELMSRIINDLDNLRNTLNNSITQIISGIFTLLATMVAMFSINVTLSLVSIVVIPLISIVVIKISKKTRKQFVNHQERLADVNSFVEEYVSGQKVIKAFNKEKEVVSNFDVKNITLKKEGFKAQFLSGVVMPIAGSINMIGTAISMVLSGILAIRGKITIGNIISFNKFSSHFGRPINEIANQFNVIQSGIAGAERMFEILDEEDEYVGEENKKKIKNIKGHVEFKNVSFSYDGKTKVIQNFSLEVLPGQSIALVGPTGAGKTTIINLLTRFYDIQEGEILIDGVNIQKINKKDLRRKLGIVLQDTVMFSESVKDNIRYGKLDASINEIKEAAKVSNAHQFIKRLKNGYDTIISEDGGNISVGQRQLINISRVVLNNPDILVLDEATSNVDTRTEIHVQQAMQKLLKGRTSFVIAHRLSTIRNADKIVVINEGKIQEIGNHETLIEQKKMYSDMYNEMKMENKSYYTKPPISKNL